MKFLLIEILNGKGQAMKQNAVVFVSWMLGLFCYLLLLSGCTDDLGLLVTGSVREGIPVKVRVKMGMSTPQQVITRAEGDDVVYDYYILVFGSDRKLKSKHYYNNESDQFTEEKDITLETTSGQSYIFSVANIVGEGIPSEYGSSSVTQATQQALADAEIGTFSIADLKALRIGLVDNVNPDVINRQKGSFTMSGKYVSSTGDLGDGYCIIPEETSTLTGEIQLYRTDACITFNLYTGDKVVKSTESGAYEPVFTPTSFRVVNIPRFSGLMNEVEDCDGVEGATAPEEDFYYTIPASTPVTISQNVTGTDGVTYQTFTFYMPENRKNAKQNKQENGNPLEYSDRERQEKTPISDDTRVENGAWIYAPERGTYVIINGTFRGYTRENGEIKPLEANVTYKIHLGNFSATNNYDYSNFQTARNTNYTYNVRVNGVDNIIVEVENGNEDEPGATGDVYYTDETNLYTLDAHFETCLMRFTKPMVVERPDRLTYRVYTPFTDYLEDTDENKQADANWVRFAVNNVTAGGGYNANLRSYTDGNASGGNYEGGSYQEGGLLTVDELIKTLQYLAEHENDSRWKNNEFVVTCFVNEYYYTQDNNESGYMADYQNGAQYRMPSNATNVSPDVPAWKYAVNQPNRVLQLLCDVRSSADGESSIVDAAYVISQRSIQTFYNSDVALSKLTSALGLETINETGTGVHLMGYSANWNTDYPQDFRQGLKNTKDMWEDKKIIGGEWANFIDAGNNGYKEPMDVIPTDASVDYVGLDDQYKYVYAACLQRNRDVNRNGKIDEEEVKWYLPALNQYAAIYMGTEALSQESRFYTNSRWTLKHFYSSTYNDVNNNGMAADDVMTVWTEEGFSTSTYSQSEDWLKEGGSIERFYRCVRNLGNTAIDNPNEVPQNYWYRDENNDHLILFTYLDPEAIRQTPLRSGELSSTHTNQYNQNRVYFQFEYATRDAGSTITAANVHSNNPRICQNYSQDSKSWRIPNHRELLFLALNSNPADNARPFTDFNNGNNYHSRTLFEWYSVGNSRLYKSPLNDEYRYGFHLLGSTHNIALQESATTNWNSWSYNVRCVRDAVE